MIFEADIPLIRLLQREGIQDQVQVINFSEALKVLLKLLPGHVMQRQIAYVQLSVFWPRAGLQRSAIQSKLVNENVDMEIAV